jgi:hypothetical protein
VHWLRCNAEAWERTPRCQRQVPESWAAFLALANQESSRIYPYPIETPTRLLALVLLRPFPLSAFVWVMPELILTLLLVLGAW